MCRPTALGGRRCPSHTDPTFVANRNARRRAQYAKYKSHPRSPKPQTAPIQDFFSTTTFEGKTGEQLYQAASEVFSHPELGITTRTYGGHLVDMKYFNKTEVYGVINHTNLDEESYKAFGFTDPLTKTYRNYMPSSISDLSEAELSACSQEEKSGFRYFTGQDYQWINDALYHTNSLTPSDYNSPAKLKGIVDAIDSGLKITPHRSRVLYRGMHLRHGSFENQKADEWIDKNISLGQEMVLDGYHSTSMSESIAADYAGEGGVLYEILTPEGVNISSISKWGEEAEVILPRKSRYMVVGVHKGAHSENLEDNATRKLSVIQLVAVDEQGSVLNSENHHVITKLTDDDFRSSE